MNLVKYLEADHKSIRLLMDEIRSPKKTPAQKRHSFEQLARLTISHVHAEEVVVYEPCTEQMQDQKAKADAYEGYEEHQIVEDLIAGVRATHDHDVWEAKATVLCELLEHHLDEEEEAFFPRLKDVLSPSELKAAEHLYLKLRQKESSSTVRHAETVPQAHH